MKAAEEQSVSAQVTTNRTSSAAGSRWGFLLHDCKQLLFIGFIFMMWNGPGRLVRHRYRRAVRSGRIFYVDSLGR